MTETTDIKALSDRLRSLAKTATPGKWWIDSHGEALVAFTDEGVETVLKPEHLRDKAHRDENTGSLSYWPNDSDASWIAAAQPQSIIALLDQLEAERQRADDLQRINGIQETTIEVFRHKELAALKGDQVPVAFTAARWLDTRCKLSVWTDRESAVMEIGDNSKVAELYDRPQKPVELPSLTIGEVMHRSGYDREYAEGWVSANDNAIREIKAAGGIVKDGE